MDLNDLEEDCAPTMAASIPRFDPFDGRLEKLKSEDRCDSDLGSSISNESGVITDIREQILKHSLKVEPPVDEVEEVTEKLSSVDIDEGICESEKLDDIDENESSAAAFTDDDFLVYGRDADGDTLLHLAIISGHVMLAKVFVEVAPWTQCLDIYNDKLRQTPLHLAVLMKQLEIVRLLLDNGANPEMFDHKGDTALHIACRSGNVTMVNEILKRRQSRPMQNLDFRNYDGHTCLHLAVLGGYKRIVDILLQSGADVNVGDGKSGATALHLAARGNREEIISLLLEQPEIVVDIKMYNGVTPLMIAAEKGLPNISNILVTHNANTNLLSYHYSSSSDESEEEED